jgi:hypothetical protein
MLRQQVSTLPGLPTSVGRALPYSKPHARIRGPTSNVLNSTDRVCRVCRTPSFKIEIDHDLSAGPLAGAADWNSGSVFTSEMTLGPDATKLYACNRWGVELVRSSFAST